MDDQFSTVTEHRRLNLSVTEYFFKLFFSCLTQFFFGITWAQQSWHRARQYYFLDNLLLAHFASEKLIDVRIFNEVDDISVINFTRCKRNETLSVYE